MGAGVPLVRIGGVRVSAHWSVLFLAALLVWGVATAVVPGVAPGTPGWAAWLVATGIVLLLLVSLTAHEVAHSIVAQRSGVRVEGITLWMLGGASNIAGDWESPRTELRVALAGPATSLVIAAVSWALALLLAVAGLPALVVVVPWWLALMNTVLLVFNLVPAFPLDGGRVMRAWLWSRRHDRAAATREAAAAGRVFAWLLIGGGVVELLAFGDLGGAWLALVGWFLDGASRAEAQSEALRHGLEGVLVRDVMSPDPVVAPAWLTVEAMLEHFFVRYHYSGFPVHDPGGAIVGLVTLRGIREVPPSRRAVVRVGEVAVPISAIPRAAPDEPVTALVSRMTVRSAGRALVFEGQRLVGVVTPTDLARRAQLAEIGATAPRAA